MTTKQRWIPKDPEYRAGLYKSIEQVPEHQRLRNYEERFRDRDCWSEYITSSQLLGDSVSDNHRRFVERAEQRWKSFVQSRGRHHALCVPQDAEAYANYLLDEFSLIPSTAAEYWSDIERFYRWMFYHADYPHRYHPFVMAATNYETSRELWNETVEPN